MSFGYEQSSIQDCSLFYIHFRVVNSLSHHLNLSTGLKAHNLFAQNKNLRTLSLNTSHFISFRNPIGLSSIMTIVWRIFPSNPQYLAESNIHATLRAYGFILIDFYAQDMNFMLTSEFFDREVTIYLRCVKKKIVQLTSWSSWRNSTLLSKSWLNQT